MNARPIRILAMVLVATVLGLLGCGRNLGSQNPLAPGLQGGQGGGAVAPGAVGDGSSSAGPGMSSSEGDDDDARGLGLPDFDADDFVREVDNQYFPLVPGTVYRYVGKTEDGLETNTVKVTRKTKRIIGVTTIEVRDQVFLDGELKEDTFDWYAQDEDGNVWYFGEDTKELEDGKVVSTEGTWLAGKDGAKPGIIMLANPRPGDSYPQEIAPGVAEDQARVVALNKTVKVLSRTFRNCLQTFETTPLDPASQEDKFYAPGVGNVLVVSRTTGQRTELKSVSRPGD